ncbi:thiamine-phosphate kinase [Algisphaera agarilytica]|uniref:Thiamine-monophosphate kinase n=1 Tax=Algisphaera agarilytica TaxID=1385975 RepID=A0A7X0H5E6_9BACT|nr:thiamine-phosphate kinase [Algisphaera agarilytica]MBB6428451.1 thiamine-monophosphate kinase [Algisphaera agarilytica]
MRENDLLQHVYAGNTALPDAVTIPPGDDMGAITFGDRSLLVAVDQVADGVHFDLANTPLAKVGRKAITRNLSDIAAMAAKPTAAVVAACLPRDFGEANATALFNAMRDTAQTYSCPLIGGDTAIWDGKLLLSVTVFAEPWRDAEDQPIAPVERTGAQPGDAIYVTGELGHSFPTGHHLDFEPRIELARELVLASGGATRPTAMIDLSDGIAQDLPRLVEHAELQMRILPLRQGESVDGREPWQHALGDGEDYELLFTAPADAVIPHAFGHDEDESKHVLITRIGTVTDAGGIVVVTPEGESLALDQADAKGWEHTA